MNFALEFPLHLLHSSMNVRSPARERSLAFATNIDDTGHFQSFDSEVPGWSGRRADLHPLGNAALSRRTPASDVRLPRIDLVEGQSAGLTHLTVRLP